MGHSPKLRDQPPFIEHLHEVLGVGVDCVSWAGQSALPLLFRKRFCLATIRLAGFRQLDWPVFHVVRTAKTQTPVESVPRLGN